MSINLTSKKLKTGEVLGVKYGQTMVESDIIVPDVKPDILKVLNVSGDVCIKQKMVQQDRVFIQGVVKINILYVPDGEVVGKIKCIVTTQDFNHSLDVSGATPEMQIFAEAEVESLDFSLINSRKVNVRGVIGLSAKVTRPVEIDITTGVEDDDSIKTKCDKILVCNSTNPAQCQVILREQLDIPSGKPTIGEILKTGAAPNSLEIRMVDGKAVVKGQVKLSTLYGAEDEEGSIQYMEHILPFSDVFDVEDSVDDMDGDVDYSVSDMYVEIREDSDGEARCLGVEIVLDAFIKGTETMEIDAISDAYSLDGDVEIEKQGYNIEQLIDNLTAQVSHKDRLSIPSGMPPAAQICDVNSSAKVNRISVEDGNIVVAGSVTANMLYMTEDGNTPVASMGHTSDFTHTFDCPKIGNDCACDAKVVVDHASYNMNGSDEIELRFAILLSVKVVKAGETELVTAIRKAESQCPRHCPCIVIYFAQEGDTLWDIAKRYHTTVDTIKKVNSLDNDRITVGQQIKICKPCA